MLWQRVLSAVVGIPVVVVLVRLGGIYLAAPLLLLAAVAVGELRSKCAGKGIRVFGVVAWPFAVGLPLLTYLWSQGERVLGETEL